MSPAWGRASAEPGSRTPGCAGACAGAPGEASARAGKCCHGRPGSGCRSGAGHRAGAGGGAGSGKRPLPGAGPGCTGRRRVWAVRLDSGRSRVPGSHLPTPGSWSRLTALATAPGDIVTQTLTRGGITWKLRGQPWPLQGRMQAGSPRGSCRPLGLSGCWQWAWGRLPKPPPLGVTPLQHGPGFSPWHRLTCGVLDLGNEALVRALAWSGPRAGLLLGAGTLPTIPAGLWDHRALSRPGEVARSTWSI